MIQTAEGCRWPTRSLKAMWGSQYTTADAGSFGEAIPDQAGGAGRRSGLLNLDNLAALDAVKLPSEKRWNRSLPYRVYVMAILTSIRCLQASHVAFIDAPDASIDNLGNT